MTDTNLFPEHMPDIPLDDLPVPLVPGGFWDPDDAHHQRIVPPDEPDYESLVRSAFLASITVLGAKIASIVIVANALGIVVSIALWGGFVPYLAVEITDQASNVFATIITGSTIGMAFAATVIAAWPMIRPRWSRLEVLGRAVAVVIVFETWIFEAVQQITGGDALIVRWDLAWITPVVLAAAGMLVFLSLKQLRRVADTTDRSMDAPPYADRLIVEDRA